MKLQVFILVITALMLTNLHAVELSAAVPVNSQTIKHTVAEQEFVWNFSCGEGSCLIGKFIGGDYWVSPAHPDDKVTIHSVSPEGIIHGLEKNPRVNSKQGFLSCQKASYSVNKNLMTRLPMVVQSNTSLVKAFKSNKKCGTKSIKGCCVGAYDVLTVLEKSPVIKRGTAFRPAFASEAKHIYYLDDFDFNLVPNKFILKGKIRKQSYQDVKNHWYPAYVDHFMSGLGDRGRAFAPHLVIPDYGATQASKYLEGLLTIMSIDSLEKKRPAVIGLLQRGIDLHASWDEGIRWHSGAGQQMGRKPPIVFFASLIKDQNIKKSVMKMALSNGNDTQEDGQIRLILEEDGGAGTPIWGDVGRQCSEDKYWSQLRGARSYDGAMDEPNVRGDNKRTCGDPYGWVDGPAGKPGTFYMACCSTGGFIAYALAMNLMPELCRVNNDPVLNEYVWRVLTKGLHTQPDPCAPPDPRELRSCRPYKKGNGCMYYGKTWGPDPLKNGSCIVNGTNGTAQSGRFPQFHGEKLTRIYNEPNISKYLRNKYGHNIFSSCDKMYNQAR